MRPINHLDSDNNEIFEGDTLLFESNQIFFEEPFIDFLKIDKVTVTVLPMHGQTGIKLQFHFYSGENQPYTYQAKKDYLDIKNPTKKENNEKWLSSIKGDINTPIDVIITNTNDTQSYHHSFRHKNKKIIHSLLTNDEKEIELKNTQEPQLFYCGKTAPLQQSFLVELTEKAKKRAIEMHDALYESELGYEGDFTHIELRPNIQRDGEHRFTANPVNKDLEATWLYITDSWDKRQAYRKEHLLPLTKDLEEWKENKPVYLDEDAYERILTEKTQAYDDMRFKIRDMKFVDKTPITDMFLGFGISDNLLTYFIEETGSTVTLID